MLLFSVCSVHLFAHLFLSICLPSQFFFLWYLHSPVHTILYSVCKSISIHLCVPFSVCTYVRCPHVCLSKFFFLWYLHSPVHTLLYSVCKSLSIQLCVPFSVCTNVRCPRVYKSKYLSLCVCSSVLSSITVSLFIRYLYFSFYTLLSSVFYVNPSVVCLSLSTSQVPIEKLDQFLLCQFKNRSKVCLKDDRCYLLLGEAKLVKIQFDFCLAFPCCSVNLTLMSQLTRSVQFSETNMPFP